MSQSTRSRQIKVERLYRESGRHLGAPLKTTSRIRLQGDWLKKIFPPDSYVRVVLIESRNGNGVAIALEPIAKELSIKPNH